MEREVRRLEGLGQLGFCFPHGRSECDCGIHRVPLVAANAAGSP
jgi:hypothetical protein